LQHALLPIETSSADGHGEANTGVHFWDWSFGGDGGSSERGVSAAEALSSKTMRRSGGGRGGMLRVSGGHATKLPPKEAETDDALAIVADRVWQLLMHIRKAGPHHSWKGHGNVSSNWLRYPGQEKEEMKLQEEHTSTAADRTTFGNLVWSSDVVGWCIFGGALALMLSMDILVLQHLPETEGTNIVVLLFWFLVAVTFGAEIWLRLGLTAGAEWATGYLLEVLFSVDAIFVNYLIFTTLEVPRRLLVKATFVGMIGCICLRLLLFHGLAAALPALKKLPILLGAILVYFGANGMRTSEDGDDEWSDVMHTRIVRWARTLLGDRLCEFYDEEKELFFLVSKGRLSMTLLGVVVSCVLFADLFLGIDVVLTKAEAIPNAYLNFTSSAIALFSIRALFFVARDLFCRFHFTNAGVGFVLIFLGAELIFSRTIYVSAAVSFLGVISIVAFATLASWISRSPFVAKLSFQKSQGALC
jgi:tellurite resistance protein TerC